MLTQSCRVAPHERRRALALVAVERVDRWYHGGPGNRCSRPAPPRPAPVAALDAACMRHDACTVDLTIPACARNQRLAADPRAPMDEREAANFTAEGVPQLPCR